MSKEHPYLGVNWILNIFYNPCDGKPWIYIELLFPAILLAIWEYLQPGWKDIVQYATGKSWLKHGRVNLGPGALEQPTFASRGLRFLFAAAEHLDRFAWQFMVLELFKDTYIKWHSMVLNLGGCDPSVERTWGRSTIPSDGRPTNHEWQGGVTWITEEGNQVPFVGPRVQIDANGTGSMTVVGQFFPLIGAQLRVQQRIVRLDTGDVLDHDEDGPIDPAKTNQGSMVHAVFHNTGTEPVIIEHQVRLMEGQEPLVWLCGGGFCSMSHSKGYQKITGPGLPYVALDVPNRTHTRKPYLPKTRHSE